MRFVIPSLLLAGACGNGSEISPYASGSLELPTVEVDEELTSSRKDLGGTISVEANGSATTVQVDTSAGRTNIDLTSPSNADLSVLDGEDRQLSLAEDPLSDLLSVMVKDKDGEVVYLLETIAATVLSSEAFSPTFVDLGNDLGTVPVELADLRLYSAYFQTDDGEIEVFPGEPVEATIDGNAYRVVLLASWIRELHEGATPNCQQVDEVMAFEVTRIEAGSADLAPLTRPDTAAIDGGSCSAP